MTPYEDEVDKVNDVSCLRKARSDQSTDAGLQAERSVEYIGDFTPSCTTYIEHRDWIYLSNIVKF
ncbi:uncharacterized protein PHALS_13272 [Plasmopara halstedii]|uniref:Uncharacterized protein n=1 Tax=Plasmopara halstedii TaxID=4781 RepID=A0A0P1AQD2_PLAHL|nr:uncharacterized protein PHALS_13272 [Plasmopara halstedii]CEG43050.1 hypothetical protein PHALS_13272 [Plasmopara halstedii]|eukprot:XP_024579419.1 hypothetical protein PHALS_13272 [Plasmopara halstedii]